MILILVPLPLLVEPPVYPFPQLKNNIQGYVDMVFEVDEMGSPRNIRVKKSYPNNVFVKHALEAIKKWKYKQRLVNGRLSYYPEIRYRMVFELYD